MADTDLTRKLVAILSADAVGYSRLMADDELATGDAIRICRSEIAGQTERNGGRVIDSPGDQILAVFPTSLDAVRCAMEIQRVLGERNEPLEPQRRMEFRIGLHVGDILEEEGRIYGDGVNISSRLEGLSDPGGACMSAALFEQVRNRMDMRVIALGPRELKNIPGAIAVYRLIMDDEVAPAGFPTSASDPPAIAVLPFTCMSSDPEVEHFADGLCEDLVTSLSHQVFPVIARNSTFTYKGRAVPVVKIGQELHARYVVEGSVRRSAESIRVVAQLIDARTGLHIWAETYDRILGETLALQDEITEAVVSSMGPSLHRFESERAVRMARPDLDAWECAQRGWWHIAEVTHEDNEEAKRLFLESIERDPGMVWAYLGLMNAYFSELFYQWAIPPFDELRDLAERAVKADPRDPHAHLTQTIASALTGDAAGALGSVELAVELNPSLADGHYTHGFLLDVAGRPEEALKANSRAIRLSPKDPGMWRFLGSRASILSSGKRYEEVLDVVDRILLRRPDWPNAFALRAESLAHLDRLDEARTAGEDLLRVQPDFTISGFLALFRPGHPDVIERYVEGLRKAGLPD